MLILVIIPFLLFLPGISSFFYSPGSLYSDLTISHYPNAVFLHQVLQSGLGVPLWSPNILSGYPFAADPLSGLWYPPGWLSLILPLPFGFNLSIILHMILGGLGIYFWMRSKGMQASSAIVGGLIFEMMPKLVSHFAAGHITLVYAVCWTPWLLWADEIKLTPGKYRRLWISPGVVLGIICLADVRWAAYAGLAWIGYSLFAERIPASLTQLGVARKKWFAYYIKLFSERILWILVNCFIAVLIAAPLLLPLVEYTRLSTRMALQPQEAFTLSLPPANLLGLLFPDPGGYAEWVLYPGSAALVLVGVALLTSKIRRQASFWLWIIGLSLVFSLGSAIPFLDRLAYIPGFGLLRVPPRILFLNGMAFAIVACYTVNSLLVDITLSNKKLNLFLVGLICFIGLFIGGIVLLTASLPFNFGWGAACIIVIALMILLKQNHVLPGHLFTPGLIVVCLLNLGVVDRLSVVSRSIHSVLSEGAPAAQFLSYAQSPFRIFSPSYSIPQQTALLYDLELADGIDPLQLANYVNYIERASGIPAAGYSVTLPPFSSSDPQNDNRNYVPNATLLGVLNIKYVVAAYELPDSGLSLIDHVDNIWIYRNTKALPRAWIQPSDMPLGENIHNVDMMLMQPDQVNITAKGPGLLVLSELNYPGWKVSIDDQSQPIQPVMGLLRGVELTPGVHQVEFTFRPLSVLIGICLSLFVWCFIIVTRGR